MKKVWIIISGILALVFVLIAVIIYAKIKGKESTNTRPILPQNEEQRHHKNEEEKKDSFGDDTIENKTDNIKIKLSFNGEVINVKLENNNASKTLLDLLPITVSFVDYNHIEKIAMLSEELNIEGSPSGYTPQKGDFAYYAPWKNISFFYQDFRYSESLIKLGTIESGIEKLEDLEEGTTITIEKVS